MHYNQNQANQRCYPADVGVADPSVNSDQRRHGDVHSFLSLCAALQQYFASPTTYTADESTIGPGGAHRITISSDIARIDMLLGGPAYLVPPIIARAKRCDFTHPSAQTSTLPPKTPTQIRAFRSE